MTRITLEIDDKVLEDLTTRCYLTKVCSQDFGILFHVVVAILLGCKEEKEVIQLKYKDEADRERRQ